MPPNVFSTHVRADALRRIAKNRRRFWVSIFLLILAAVLLSVAGYAGLLIKLEDYATGNARTFAAVLLALLPFFLWLALFSFDISENISARQVNFLLGLVTGALYFVLFKFVILDLFQISEWMHQTWWSNLLGKLLIVAPIEVFLIYLALRFGIYPTNAMQHLVDGLAYGVAAALGVAAAINLMAIWMLTHVTFTSLALIVGGTTLAYAGVGVWIGYFMACARFKRINIFYLASGVLLVIILHALILFATETLVVPFKLPYPLGGIILAGLFVLASLDIIFWRLRKCRKEFMRIAALVEIKEEQETPRSVLADVVQMVESHQLEPRPSPPPPPEPLGGDLEGDGDELDSLKKQWDALIAEQEENHV